MSSPIIWILIPVILAIILWFIPNRRVTIILGILISLSLALVAWLLPIDVPLDIGNLSLKISSSLTILGRHLILTSTDQPILIYLYSSICFWYLGSIISGSSSKSISFGLVITSLLISALAVEPFLYAALLIETAVLISIPFLLSETSIPGRGLMRYLTFQTIAMIFILFSGWLLSGTSTSPAGSSIAGQAIIYLGLGLIFMLAIFPFNSWIPLLSEEAASANISFILWILTTIGLLFSLYFMDTYSWIRESIYLATIFRISGLIMVISGGIWTAFQRDMKRMIGYAMIMEIGNSMLALSIKGDTGINLFFGLLLPRTISLFLFASAVTIILNNSSSGQFTSIKGAGRKFPFASAIVVLSIFSFAGLPLLAGFPIHQSLWVQLGRISLGSALGYFIATIGLLTGGIRVLTVLVTSSDQEGFFPHENWWQRIYLLIGFLIIIFMGIFPQWAYTLTSRFPLMFNHLAK